MHPKLKLKGKLSIGINTSLSLLATSKSQRKTPSVMSSNRIRPEYALLMLLATLIPLQLAAPVTDSDPDTDSDSNWDPADTTISPYTEDSIVPQAETEVDGQRIDCKLTFDAATMESLGCHNKPRESLASMEAEPGPGQGQGPDSAANKPEDIAQDPEVLPLQMQRHLKRPDSQPIYELQLVVWPSDIEDGDDFSPPLATTTTTTTTSTTTKPPTTTTTGSTTTTIGTPIEQIWPLYEDQLVVFPQMDFEEENLDYFFDDVGPSSTTTSPSPPTTGSSTTWHPTGTPTPTPTYVVQNYHVIHPNGTEEYKLVMSNGLVNYKKIYTKTVGDQVINVQEGYNSVPIPGPRNQIQTQYYIADERGYNVYRIEVTPRQMGLAKNLHYKATKTTHM
ncbi:rho GTPase-activating protein gacJ [Drosophila ananassae]|nr:rho GTPase-activating protein gacJ [Drosophila ananassae]